jgi:hypothetical protein
LPDRGRPCAIERKFLGHRAMLLHWIIRADTRLRQVSPPVGLGGIGARFAAGERLGVGKTMRGQQRLQVRFDGGVGIGPTLLGNFGEVDGFGVVT